MEQYIFETGDLELLAMGALPVEKERALYLLLEENEVLRAEYEEIESSLFLTSNENAVEPPKQVKDEIASFVFEEVEEKSTFSFSAVNVFKMAASILLIGSLAFNFILWKDTNSKSTISESIVGEDTLEDLPFSEPMFNEMFAYLKTELSEEPCKMDFRTTRAFLSSHNLDTPENLAFLKDHEGHCDCEVLMNVAQYFPDNKYRHGGILPKVHKMAKPMAVSFLRQYRVR
ncbi:DUF2695 domain-containing protein [uncultured Arcticibacterium sp.]|uniref:DUF2695 domain-containing protein n=1 Tax=uncultured Arcticibacterium sp. TaxID=2173042 RepID=UPI0030F6F20C